MVESAADLGSRRLRSRIGGTFYGLPILTPGMFLERERVGGRLREEYRQSTEKMMGCRLSAIGKVTQRAFSPVNLASRIEELVNLFQRSFAP